MPWTEATRICTRRPSKDLKEVSRSEKTYITDEQHDYKLAVTRDAFSAHRQVTADVSTNETIALTRAVAQLNIFTTDYDQLEESFRPAYTGLTISTAADFNVLTGTSFGSATSDLRSYVAIKTEKGRDHTRQKQGVHRLLFHFG